MLTITAVPLLSDNYAWLLRDSATGTTAIVDPAVAPPVMDAVAACAGRLDLILLTHHHADHIGGAEALRAGTGAHIVGAAADAHRLPRLDQGVAEGDRVRLGETMLDVLETPGHTVGHIAYVGPGALLCGDTMFSLGCGRLFEGTAGQMFASLRKFASLPTDTNVYCGHEYTASNARFALHVDPDNAALQAMAERVRTLRQHGQPTVPSLLADELAANPFLRAADSATLAQLRSQKDRF